MQKTQIWRLKKGMDRRFRSGHPWVYSNELQDSPKGHPPGELVRLHDAGGQYLATGFGNPHSLIAFRVLTRDAELANPVSKEALTQKLSQAVSLRHRLGFASGSFRLCFGEADGLPGLVVDRYLTPSGQVMVTQAHTAGADHILRSSAFLEALQSLSTVLGTPWEQTSVITRNDVSVRTLEGLEREKATILVQAKQAGAALDFSSMPIRVRNVGSSEAPILFQVDLLGGQKTGFFLDQWANIELVARRLATQSSPLKILDLCCYVGQWGVQLGTQFQNSHVTAIDASTRALEFAEMNLKQAGIKNELIQGDVLKDLAELKQQFDLVIVDPPALIKSKKDIPTGTAAYVSLATEALKRVKTGGTIVVCSCSRLLTEESFEGVLAKGVRRSQVQTRWIARGSQSPDHPMLMEFPEGRYLKAWIGSPVTGSV